ncbi:SH3 domain-containing protein [uncultured Fretibacterium sp.]|uniref:SH3 domain-containing protein n=1 Tax=uncultured Fretibacterium sp. TaxID=1678694 RepID=UPI00325FD237
MMLAGVGMRISQSFGSAPDRDLASMGAAGVGVLFASMLALAGGGLALGRRRGASVLLLVSAALCGMAFLGGFHDAAIWGTLYMVAAVFAYLGAQRKQGIQAEPAPQPGAQSVAVGLQKQGTDQWTQPKMGSEKEPRSEDRSPDDETIAGLDTDALVVRAFLFLEDGCFPRADRYLEQALNQDPKNSRAYLGKLMVELNAHDEKELADSLTPLEGYKHYQRALQFADDEGKARLTDYAQAVLKKTEERQKAEQEARYFEAAELKAQANSAITYKQAAQLFGELGSYKDSREMAVLCERLAVEKGAQEKRKSFWAGMFLSLAALAALMAKPTYKYLSRSFAHKSEVEREMPGSLPPSKSNENLSPLPPSSPKAVEPQVAPQGPETVMALGSLERAASLHEHPNPNSPVVGQIPAKHIFPIIEARVEEGSKGRWYRISSEKYGKGWIPEDDVRLEGEEETISDFIQYGEDEFNGMRREAEEDFQSLQRFIAEKKLPHHVVAGGNIYLVRSYGFSLMEVRGNKVNLRREPNTSSEVIMQMNEGYPVDADAYWTRADGRETWYYVRTPDGREGWVSGNFVGERPR